MVQDSSQVYTYKGISVTRNKLIIGGLATGYYILMYGTLMSALSVPLYFPVYFVVVYLLVYVGA